MDCTVATGSNWRRGWIRQIEISMRLSVNRHCAEFSIIGRLPEGAAKNAMASDLPGLGTTATAMLENPVSCFGTGSNLAANWKQAHIYLSRKTVSGRQCTFDAKNTSSTKSLFIRVRSSG